MQLPAKTKTIAIKGNEYTVTFPTNRQLMDIFAKKAQYSKEMYDAINYSLDGNTKYVGLLIDAVSTFEVILPKEFFKDLNAPNIVDLDVIQGAELVRAYQRDYEDWFNEWTKSISLALNPVQENA